MKRRVVGPIAALLLSLLVAPFAGTTISRVVAARGTLPVDSLLLLSQAVAAQAPRRVPRIGVLSSWSPTEPTMEAFRHGLRDVGYVEGQNLLVEYRYAEGRLDQLPGLAAELVALKVEVIVAAGTRAIRAAKDATSTIPIVMPSNADPVGEVFVQSLPRPGGNITGSTHISPELSAKRLQLLKEAFPWIARVAILYDPSDGGVAPELEATRTAAPALGLTLQMVEVHAPDEFEEAFAMIAKERGDALLTLSHTFTLAHRKRIVELAAKRKLPAMYGLREFVDDGGLMSYHSDRLALYRRAGVFVDKILKGAKPADLPVERPIKFELVVNLKTARELGLTLPPSILFQANEGIR